MDAGGGWTAGMAASGMEQRTDCTLASIHSALTGPRSLLPAWPAGRLLTPLQKARGVRCCLSGGGSGQRMAVYPDLVAITRATLEHHSLLAQPQ